MRFSNSWETTGYVGSTIECAQERHLLALDLLHTPDRSALRATDAAKFSSVLKYMRLPSKIGVERDGSKLLIFTIPNVRPGRRTAIRPLS